MMTIRIVSKQIITSTLAVLAVLAGSPSQGAMPESFAQAKVIAKQKVYYDRNTSDQGTLYCGCKWSWAGKTGGQVNFDSCGYQIRAQENRAARIEYEHIVPASWFGQQRQCWQKGGRSNCTKNDPQFSIMEADLHNLSPVVGEMNADRSNYRYGLANTPSDQYGQCASKTDFKGKVFEPRDEAKGMVARVYFYMYDRYGLKMSAQQERLLMAWDKKFPVTDWEVERNNRIYNETGVQNSFVTGQKKWVLGYKPSGEGLK